MGGIVTGVSEPITFLHATPLLSPQLPLYHQPTEMNVIKKLGKHEFQSLSVPLSYTNWLMPTEVKLCSFVSACIVLSNLGAYNYTCPMKT